MCPRAVLVNTPQVRFGADREIEFDAMTISPYNEDTEGWMKHFRAEKGPLQLDDEGSCMSDRNKGIAAGLDEVFPKTHQLLCKKHLEGNFTAAKLGNATKAQAKQLGMLAYARTKSTFEELEAKLLTGLKPKTKKYVLLWLL